MQSLSHSNVLMRLVEEAGCAQAEAAACKAPTEIRLSPSHSIATTALGILRGRRS